MCKTRTSVININECVQHVSSVININECVKHASVININECLNHVTLWLTEITI